MWIKISDKLPRAGVEVDIWADGKRYPSYVLNKNYGGKRGNDFFSPVHCGPTCIRFDGSIHYTQATHWMPLPAAPTIDNMEAKTKRTTTGCARGYWCQVF